MAHLPRLGPKLAPPPTDLDDNSQERLDEFIRMTGDGKVVSTRRLLWLAIVQSGPLELRDRRSLKSAHETIVLSAHTVVMTSQEFIGAAKVNYYVTALHDGKDIKPVRVTDIGENSGWWHLDGLHRLLAARILGRSVDAKVFR